MNPAIHVDAAMGDPARATAWEEAAPRAVSIGREEPLSVAAPPAVTAEPRMMTRRLERLLMLSRQYQQSTRR